MMVASFITHSLIISALVAWWTSRQPRELRKYFLPGLGVKLMAGIGIGLLYSEYYDTGDTFVYFADGKELSLLARHDAMAYLRFLWSQDTADHLALTLSEPRALFFVKFVSLVNLITFDNYWITATYFSLLAFAGAWYLFRMVDRYFPGHSFAAFISFLFFPSVVFWTSGLVKECIASAALFYLSGLFLKAWFDLSIGAGRSFLGVLALWVLWGLKYYYAAIFLPVTFTCLVYRYLLSPLFRPKTFLGEASVWITFFLIPLLIVSFAHPNFYLERFLEVIVLNHDIYKDFSDQSDIVRFRDLSPTVESIIANSPLALFSGLFRPAVFEAGNLLQVAAAIENAVLVVLTVFAAVHAIRSLQSRHRVIALAVMVYIILLCVFITLSTPNFGTLSRYRIGYLPFFIYLISVGNPALKFFERAFTRLVR